MHTASSITLNETLKSHFGHTGFRSMQRSIIDDALAGRDVLVVMPTGGGKSLCFQLPALVDRGMTLVISPLIALMQNQVELLKANGIAATFLNSTLNRDEARRREHAAIKEQYKLIYYGAGKNLQPCRSNPAGEDERNPLCHRRGPLHL